MSEQTELNQDPLARKLGRLTPDSSTLDRDTLLVRLGQASARRGRFWPLATAALAASQAITLFLLFTQRPQSAAPRVEMGLPLNQPAPASNSGPDASPNGSQLLTYWGAIRSGDIDDLPREQGVEGSVAQEKVLTAHSARSILEFE